MKIVYDDGGEDVFETADSQPPEPLAVISDTATYADGMESDFAQSEFVDSVQIDSVTLSVYEPSPPATVQSPFEPETDALPQHSEEDLRAATNYVSEQQARAQPSSSQNETPQNTDRKTQFGLRIAPNTAIANVVVVSRTAYDETNDNLGFGIEGGLVIDIPFRNQWSFYTGASLVYRTPVNTDNYKVSETALALPALLRMQWENRWTNSASIYGGAQLDIVLSSVDDRNTPEILSVIGITFGIGSRFEIDFKGGRGFREFVDTPEQSGTYIEHMSFGITYLFGN